MGLNEFYNSPTAKDAAHRHYNSSFFRMRPSPEYATGEVLMSSLYRKVGYPSLSEKNVPSQGNEFYKRVQSPIKQLVARDSKISARGWGKIIDEVLKSPKQPNQSRQRFLQLTPLVPELALYTSAARLRGNTWNPGELIHNVIGYSPIELSGIEKTWKRIFESLDVTSSDDVWARFLAEELVSWRPPSVSHEWKYEGYGNKLLISREDARSIETPAKRLYADLNAVLNLKTQLTRRQWISMLESVLRIGTASHVLWICHVNEVIWSLFQACLGGEEVDHSQLGKMLSVPEHGFWKYGDKALPAVKNIIRNYYIARIGINQILHIMDDLNISMPTDGLSSVKGLSECLNILRKERDSFSVYNVMTKHRELLDQEPRQLACAKGITSNILEFVRYSLGQRQTAEIELKGYDQGYFLRKKGTYSAAPWVVSIGPVSAMALTYCCSVESKYPRNIAEFCLHLKGYGIFIHANDVPSSELGSILMNLGLILDSPDAEGGMMMVSPFE
jgi:hypothetical protein